LLTLEFFDLTKYNFMKTRHLLIALSISTFTIANIPQYAILAQVNRSETEPLNANTAQQLAAKITVRIQIGKSGGSGVLIAKKANPKGGNTYLVLTNARAAVSAPIRLQTPDGQNHNAQRVKNTQVGNFDLALLEFTSSRSYQLARFRNFGNGEAALNEGREIFAAGFPYDSNALRLLVGEITQLPQEPFVNGTQIGYTTKGDVKQGMSGGPIFDSFGNLVGINSTSARPIVNAYTYADGSKAPPDKMAEYARANWSVPIYNLLTRLNPDILYSYKQLPKLQRSVTPTGYMAQLDRQARLVTVRIENADGNGSGVIVARDGNSYYVLTADHVVKNIERLKLTTHEQRTYTIDADRIERSPGTDLAVVKFTSTQLYQVAKLGNYSISDKSLVFPAGWPAPKNINSQQWQWGLNPGGISSQEEGQFQTQDKKSFSNGYDLIYSSITYGGMSGGPVFDRAGRVIGIHGRAEGGGLVGKSLGISIKTFLGLTDKLNIDRRKLQIETTSPVALDDSKLASVNLVRNNILTPNKDSNAEQWIEYGNQLYRLDKYQEAVKAFNRSIALQPTSIAGNHGKGLALLSDGEYLPALKSFDRAIELVPASERANFYYHWKYRTLSLRHLRRYPEALASISQAINLESQDPTIFNEKAGLLSQLKRYPEALAIYDGILTKEPKAWAYVNRGIVKYELGDKKGSIDDYDKAIQLNPQYAGAYVDRGIAKSDLGDNNGAMSDYERAIAIDPQFPFAYVNRGIAKSASGDKKAAIVDYNRAIAIDPQFTPAYYNRGIAKSALGDKRGAIIDYNMAISIDPQDIKSYVNRGMTKSGLGDKKGAIIDYDRAIALDPQNAKAYYNRGNTRSDLGDDRAAISDYNRAIALAEPLPGRIDPQSGEVYANRGISKSKLGDKQGAIADLNMAAEVFKNRNDRSSYDRAMSLIQQLSN
jgi:tetratricopeptide (TPR) repeat protein/S1-C subfamily serine protease